MNTQFGQGFSVDTLENVKKFYLTYQDSISETMFRKFMVVFRLFEKTLPENSNIYASEY
jgi:hypothetical protein